jgi:hypothetical protein
MRYSRGFLTMTLVAAAVLGSLSAEAAPDNSLKDLMKKVNTGVLNGESKGLGPLFETLKGKGKPEFKDWGSLSDKGKAAADKGDIDGVKATCKPCHDQYRNDFKTKYGSKAP